MQVVSRSKTLLLEINVHCFVKKELKIIVFSWKSLPKLPLKKVLPKLTIKRSFRYRLIGFIARLIIKLSVYIFIIFLFFDLDTRLTICGDLLTRQSLLYYFDVLNNDGTIYASA